jgi:hypothetical protein
MANFGYDPTGTGKYGTGYVYDGVSGVNVLPDGTKSYGHTNTIVESKTSQTPPAATPALPGAISGGSTQVFVPATPTATQLQKEIKVATPDIVGAVLEKAFSNEKEMTSFFEDMGIQEILSVTRNSAMNVVNGQNVMYQPIQNLAILSLKYNSSNILPMTSAETTFKNFSISLQDKLIADGQGSGPSGATEYLDDKNNLVINVTNLQPDELVEIESLSIEGKLMVEYSIGATS